MTPYFFLQKVILLKGYLPEERGMEDSRLLDAAETLGIVLKRLFPI